MSRSSEQARKRIKRWSVLIGVLAVVAIVAIVYLLFCLAELFVLIFTGGLFSWVFPALATLMVILAFMALAIVGGGSR